ncbi:MAG: FkbM family methyltransferase [Chitinophagales bacterium]|nr:FkbM family methyltransferase [Chitinophagales bacterium]
MDIKRYIATHDNFLLSFLKFFLYKIKNKYYHVNEIIEKTEVVENGMVKVTLKEGIVMYGNPSKLPAEIQFTDRIKFGEKSKLTKIIDVDKYYFMYEGLSELFAERVHFQYFAPNQGDCVVDCGANVGFFTVQAAKMIGENGRLIAIEPDADNHKLLLKNIEANGLKNVTVVNAGVWSKKDVLTFNVGIHPGEHSFVLHDDIIHQEGIRKIEIPVDTLDNILANEGVTKVDFVKMDIEGAETEAIKGMNGVLAQEGVKWVVEAGHLVDGEMTFHKVEAYMKERGYKNLSTDGSFRGAIYAVK